MKPIDKFREEYFFLSNFYEAEVAFEGKLYPTVEHAFQAAKTLDEQEKEDIRTATAPIKAKQKGQNVTLRKEWEEIKVDIMYQLLSAKFQNPILRGKLIATGERELIEGNTWGDTFWGASEGKGENMLGKLLMKVREDILKSFLG